MRDLTTSTAEEHFLRGNGHAQCGRWPAALASYELAIAAKPNFIQAHFNRGVALQRLGRRDAAEASYAAAVTIAPAYAPGWFNRGVVLHEMQRSSEALASYERAIAAQADHAEAHCNRGTVLLELQREPEALASYEAAIALRPQFVEAWFNRGNVLQRLGRREPALASYERCLELAPAYVDALYNRGNILMELRRFEAAVASFDQAIALRPQHAGSHLNRGNALNALQRHEEALDSYGRALAIEPQLEFAEGVRRSAMQDICDWRGFDAAVAGFDRAIDRGERICSPFLQLSLSGSAARQRRTAEIWARAKYPYRAPAGACARREARRDKIRLGYFSADLRNHPVGALTAALFESHDRTGFETTAFSFGPVTQDPLRARLERAFDRFIDVHGCSDREIVAIARELQIDIAVDLMGYTDGCRPGVFAGRVAPLQVGYLGYLGTLALNLDYLIADQVLVPAEQREHYAEKILYLPWYQPNDHRRAVPAPVTSRLEFGLPEGTTVFCCFNSSFKINPETFASWMRILRRTPGSLLWLYAPAAIARQNLTASAAVHGVAANRLLFADWLPPEEHLRRYGAADLFLDSAPYNAGTTASDALWASLPVITLRGDTFAGRMAASVLTAAGLSELITSTRDDYENLAVSLASDSAALGRIRARLERDRHQMPLFDTPRFTAGLESAYRAIYARALAGQAPDHVENAWGEPVRFAAQSISAMPQLQGK